MPNWLWLENVDDACLFFSNDFFFFVKVNLRERKKNFKSEL